MEFIDMICTCDRCQEEAKDPDAITIAVIQCEDCKTEMRAANLKSDIWPMFFDCPFCGSMKWYEFIETE